MARHTGIRKLANGRFRARYFRGYDVKSGRRVYPARTFDTEREARDWRSTEIASRGSSIIEGRSLNLAAYLDHWLATKLDIRENSRRQYQVYIDTYIKPQLGQVKLLRLMPTQIEQWQADLSSHLKSATVLHIRSVLSQALRAAARKNLIRANPVKQTDGPKQKRPERHPLTIEDALQIINACETAEHGLAYQLIAHCGLRPEEVLGLGWADLDLANNTRGTLRISRVVYHMPGKEGWKFYRPKTANSERAIRFSAELASKLIEHRRKQREQRLRMGRLWQDHDLVFANDIGQPLKRPALAYRFAKLIARLGLPKKITMYTLRHFFVTSSLIAGVDFKTVSREAGHAKVSFTMDRYGHVLDEMHDVAADKREQLLKKRSRK